VAKLDNEKESLDRRIDTALQMASLAPSAHNTQPWEFRRRKSRIHVCRSQARTLEVGDPTTRQACLAVGMFVETFAIAASHAGLDIAVTTRYATPTETELAIIDVTGQSAATQSELSTQLFDGITRRRTNRGTYAPNGCAPWLDDWRIESGGVHLSVIRDPATKEVLALAAGKAIRLALSLPAMRRELASLVHWSTDSFSVGMPVEALVSDAEPNLEPGAAFVRAAEPAEEETALIERYKTAPVIIVLSTARDDPAAWVSAGREGVRVMLRAAADGLSHCISAGPIEIPTLVPIVRDAIRHPTRPQLLFRLGQPMQKSFSVPSPRLGLHGLEAQE
jgi:hypothetical protein